MMLQIAPQPVTVCNVVYTLRQALRLDAGVAAVETRRGEGETMHDFVCSKTAVMLGALALQAMPTQTPAQAFPTKPMRVTVGFTAGGPADTMARVVARKLTELAGQSVIVDNRAGANGFLAGEYMVKSPADGHTCWFAAGSALSVARHLYGKLLVDPERDLALVTQVVSVPQIFVAHPSLPVKSMRDLAQLAAKRPGQLNVSVISLGGLVHLGVELFKTSAGVKMNNVQYKGGGPAMIDLIGGHIEVGLFDVPAAIAHLPTGKVRALAVTSGERVKQVPDVPTTAEAGYPNVRSDNWYGIAVPAATPPEVVRRMNQLWVAAIRAPETSDALYALGVVPVGGSIQEIQAFRVSESKKWGDLIRKINLKVE
jgi:tripartite-type tricarboxylate transporter receptor subunit TctC